MMNADTEKALLEWARSVIERHKSDLIGEDNYQTCCLRLLATLEPPEQVARGGAYAKPEPRAEATWHMGSSSRCRHTDPTSGCHPHLPGNPACGRAPVVWSTSGDGFCRSCFDAICAKPEPKRGVEGSLVRNIVAVMQGLETLEPTGDRCETWHRWLAEALRLYREERERVVGVTAEMRDAIRAPVGKAWDAALAGWAEELERRDA